MDNVSWEPIETAPKDGTRIIATDGLDVDIVVFDKTYQQAWRCGADEAFALSAIFWMPLPKPPNLNPSLLKFGEPIDPNPIGGNELMIMPRF